MKPRERRALNLLIPSNLYVFFAKMCIDLGITKTEGMIRCLEKVRENKDLLKKV